MSKTRRVRISRFHENVLLKLAEAGGISIEPLADSEEATDMLAPPSPSNKLGDEFQILKVSKHEFFLAKKKTVEVTRLTREFFYVIAIFVLENGNLKL